METFISAQGPNISVKIVGDDGRVTRRIITPGHWVSGKYTEANISMESTEIRELAAKLWTDETKATAKAKAEENRLDARPSPMGQLRAEFDALKAALTEKGVI